MGNVLPIPSEQAQRALDKLAGQFLSHPAVSLIDMGFDPQTSPDDQSPGLVLRVHLRPGARLEGLNLPTQVDGIPVRTIMANYHLE